MPTYIVKPADGSAEFSVEADSYEYDTTSGRHLFRAGPPTDAEPNGNLVANLINVSVRLDQTTTA